MATRVSSSSQDPSFPGLRTTQIRVIRSPATSNANTVRVTPSCRATRPGWPLTVRSRTVMPLGHPVREFDPGARDLLATVDGMQEGDGQTATVGDRRGVGVEQADEGVDVLGLPRRLERPDDGGLLGRRRTGL
ncbi:MAG: hypothetical protein WCA46_03340 [Actinocatenispora sp.]